MPLPRPYHALTMPLPCPYHALTMPLPCPYHALKNNNLIRCIIRCHYHDQRNNNLIRGYYLMDRDADLCQVNCALVTLIN